MAIIFHIADKLNWSASVETGLYEVPSLAEEGFIHCCTEKQINGVLERYYKDQENLIKLTIETDLLTSPVYYDWSPSVEDTFPHIYGPVNTSAVINVTPI